MSSNGALIDLDNSNNDSPQSKPLSDKPSNTFMQSAFLIPSYINDLAENNPFDLVDKQVNLLNDPFEIVENSAILVQTNFATKTCVKTGTLISLDDHQFDADEFFSNIVPEFIDSPEVAKKSMNLNEKNILSKDDSKCTPSPPSSLVDIPNVGMSTPVSRGSAKSKSNAMNLLKYTLSNNFIDATGTPEATSSEDSSQYDTPNELFTTVLEQKKLLLQSDDSFDDLASTKPNWIDSDPDIESDVDNDIANLNIPMLNKSKISVAADAECKGESKEQKTDINELMEKFASIKMRKSFSPQQKSIVVEEEEIDDLTSDPLLDISKFIENKKITDDIQNNKDTNSLIASLKQMIDQCNDKCKINEAKSLLESLSSIFVKEKSAVSHEEAKRVLIVPPQLIQRQGTFNIDRAKEDDHDKCEKTASPPKTSQPRQSIQRQETDAKTEDDAEVEEEKKEIVQPIDSAYSHYSQVLKDLQKVFQNANTGNSAGQPTVIVLMGAPSTEDVQRALNEPQQMYRRTSLSMKNKPSAAINAALKKAEKMPQTPQIPTRTSMPKLIQTPAKRQTLVRRNSFNVITRPLENASTESTEQNKVNPSKAAPKRRSLQGLFQTGTTSKESTETKRLSGEFQPSKPSIIRRKSFSNAQAPVKDSPLKIRPSAGTIKKSIAPPATKNLKIRVKESFGSRSSAPLRAVAPMSSVAPLLMINEFSPIPNKKSLITSTPRNSIPSSPNRYSRLSQGNQ